ncbi:LLM class flavin-dependent oxidoreductase [Demequina aurantiaca]|uniref:LLM class flavin-dependent oxidoreductase n=1 Tax=Demequina aurantiaca TaxID=676200 RepID=UPI003D33131A
MQLGVMSFGDRRSGADGTWTPVAQSLKEQLERIQLAEQVGLDFYGLGEHHIESYAISNPGTVLAAASSVTERITLGTAVSVVSTDDPVRLFQQFTTLDQLSAGRAEIMAGRGSFTESYPLFGASLNDYEALFDEKIQLLLRLSEESPITWSGRFRAALDQALVLPRPFGERLSVSIGTGGNPQSSVRAGMLGAPVVYAVIGGQPERFAPLVDLYRRASEQAGNAARQHVTMTAVGLIADRSQDAKNTFYPYWNQVMEYGAQARGWSVPSRVDYDHMTQGGDMIFAGSPDEIAARLISVGQLTKADRYFLQMDWGGVPHGHVMKAIELLGTRVKPQVDEAFGSRD